MDKRVKCHSVACWGENDKLCPCLRRDGFWARPSRMLCTLALGRGWEAGSCRQPRQGEQIRKVQGMCGEQQMVWSNWGVGGQGCKAKNGHVVKSISAGPALGTFLLFFWLLEYILILHLKMEIRESSRILDWKIWEMTRLPLGGSDFFESFLIVLILLPL